MQNLEEKLWERVTNYIRYLKFVPFLRMLAVCNNLAFSNANEKSDIDLFIIAKTGRLYVVRTLVTLILQLLGVRRHGKKVVGRFCLSFFVDDSYLDLSSISIENDVYLKIWIKTLRPVIDDGVGMQFLTANSWINSTIEDSSISLGESLFPYEKNRVRSFFKFLFSSWFGDFLENMLKNWQQKRALKKLQVISDSSGILISDHILKFHNLDRRREYRRLWTDKYGDSKVSLEKFRSLTLD